ncbi:hypothetical protein D9X30_5325 [Cupriavidus sp. U2]|nr:hypothetical protein D9X30_5325 [Cupriavidus sp. U2]
MSPFSFFVFVLAKFVPQGKDHGPLPRISSMWRMDRIRTVYRRRRAALHNGTSRLCMALAQQRRSGCCACEDGAIVLQSRVSSGYLSMPC